MTSALHPHHPLRIFFVSGLITIGSLIGVWYFLGPQAAFLTFVLIAIEVTFSFDNAIINARVLMTMSKFWQQMFITVGILIAVFGMRLVFPVVMVMITANLSWNSVVDLALNQPEKYAAVLHDSHISLAAFGGMFLLMLALHFFFDASRSVRWIDIFERPLQKIGKWWMYSATSLAVLLILTGLQAAEYRMEMLVAGLIGIATYVVVHGLAELFTKAQQKEAASKLAQRTGMAGFMSFLYLEVLDASFSLDGVIGAFAVTKDVVLIAIGLGIGALWVRSMTIFMVRRHVLSAYRYLEHGAHYTILLLSGVLLVSLYFNISEFIAGLAGIGIITTAILQSRSKRQHEMNDAS